jgi:endoglucanase
VAVCRRHRRQDCKHWLQLRSIVSDLAVIVETMYLHEYRTYAIEMIDQVYDREGMDVPLEVAMINSLGYVNGTKVTKEIIEKNPGWTKDTTRFEIWNAITTAAAAKDIFVHPDVHIHKAKWCCSSAGKCLQEST